MQSPVICKLSINWVTNHLFIANVSWHRADVCKKCLLYVYKNWSRSVCQDKPAWREPCTRTTPTTPWTPSCTSALSAIVKRMLFFFQRLNCTNNTRHHKLCLNAKIDGDRPIMIELWPGGFWLQNLPSQHQTSSGHISVNIGPLPSIFACKCS